MKPPISPRQAAELEAWKHRAPDAEVVRFVRCEAHELRELALAEMDPRNGAALNDLADLADQHADALEGATQPSK